MIKAKESMKDFISNQKNLTEFSERIQITRQTLYNLIQGDNVSSKIVAKLLAESGYEFEKAFELGEQ